MENLLKGISFYAEVHENPLNYKKYRYKSEPTWWLEVH